MKWLTISQINRRSKTAKGALKISYEHWCQLYDAKAKELRVRHKKDCYLILSTSCGLCIYYKYKYGKYAKCDHCLLCEGVDSKRCDYEKALWSNASNALSDWIAKGPNGDWHAWKRACKALRDKLKELMVEQESKTK